MKKKRIILIICLVIVIVLGSLVAVFIKLHDNDTLKISSEKVINRLLFNISETSKETAISFETSNDFGKRGLESACGDNVFVENGKLYIEQGNDVQEINIGGNKKIKSMAYNDSCVMNRGVAVLTEDNRVYYNNDLTDISQKDLFQEIKFSDSSINGIGFYTMPTTYCEPSVDFFVKTDNGIYNSQDMDISFLLGYYNSSDFGVCDSENTNNLLLINDNNNLVYFDSNEKLNILSDGDKKLVIKEYMQINSDSGKYILLLDNDNKLYMLHADDINSTTYSLFAKYNNKIVDKISYVGKEKVGNGVYNIKQIEIIYTDGTKETF